MDLFVKAEITTNFLFTSPVSDFMLWKEIAFQHSWNHLGVYTLTHSQSFFGSLTSLRVILVALIFPRREWFPDLLSFLVAEPLELVQLCVKMFYR